VARAKEFDEDAVLLKAMHLFWEQGYEKTSMSDLVAYMGVHKRSMYDTFGDKHSLYVKALHRYSKMVEDSIERALSGVTPAKEAIRMLFERVIQGEKPKGCLMVNTAVELAPHDPVAKAWVNEGLSNQDQMIRRLIETGQQTGEFDQGLDAEQLANYFTNALTGLRVLSKTTDDREKLKQIIDTTMLILR